MVTHDMSIAEKADKIYKMDNGKMVLFKDENGYRRASYEKQAELESV